MRPILDRVPKGIYVLLGVLVVGLCGWLAYYSQFTFHITDTNPGLSSVASISPFIKVHFNRSLTQAGLVVTSSDSSILNNSTVNNKDLVLNLNTLQTNTTYVITVQTISSNDGKTLHNQTIKFKAKDISYNKLPKDQQAAIMAIQNQTPAINNDPVFNYTPHSTLDYNLTAAIQTGGPTGTKNEVILVATLLPSAADVRINETAAIATYKQEVIDYLKSVGIDPTKYTIQYTVTEPTL